MLVSTDLHSKILGGLLGAAVGDALGRLVAGLHYQEIERSFIEEYYLKGLYGARKVIYGGQPTNGAIMCIAPLGLIHPADPKAAFVTAFELSFVTDGYAKESAAIGAAAVSAAMTPGATPEGIVETALELTSITAALHTERLETVRAVQSLIGAAPSGAEIA